MIQRLNPYINLDGAAEKAIRHYQRALGAEIVQILRFRDMPGGNSTSDRVMHSELRIGTATLMVSDTQEGEAAPEHGNVSVCLDFADPEAMARCFDALAKDGRVDYPIHDAFWGGKFGMLTDPFDVHWMFNCSPSKP